MINIGAPKVSRFGLPREWVPNVASTWDRVITMIAIWIVLGVAVAATLTWRLRKANARLGRILQEASESEPESLPTSHER